jgi:hypothetical protein
MTSDWQPMCILARTVVNHASPVVWLLGFLFIQLFGWIGAGIAWCGIKEGKVDLPPRHGRPPYRVERAKEPVGFWITIILWAGVGLGFFILSVCGVWSEARELLAKP